MKRRFVLALAAALGALAFAPPIQERATITGKVVDSRSGSPLMLAVVQLTQSMGAMTDAEGNYRMENVVPGTYSLRAMRPGYEAKVINRSMLQCVARTSSMSN